MPIAIARLNGTTYFVPLDRTGHSPKTDITISDVDLYCIEDETGATFRGGTSTFIESCIANAPTGTQSTYW